MSCVSSGAVYSTHTDCHMNGIVDANKKLAPCLLIFYWKSVFHYHLFGVIFAANSVLLLVAVINIRSTHLNFQCSKYLQNSGFYAFQSVIAPWFRNSNQFQSQAWSTDYCSSTDALNCSLFFNTELTCLATGGSENSLTKFSYQIR